LAAVDQQVGAGHEARGAAGEKDGRCRDPVCAAWLRCLQDRLSHLHLPVSVLGPKHLSEALLAQPFTALPTGQGR